MQKDKPIEQRKKALTLAEYIHDPYTSKKPYSEARADTLAKLEAFRQGTEVRWQVDNARHLADLRFYREWEKVYPQEYAAYEEEYRDYENGEYIKRDEYNEIVYDDQFFAEAPEAPIQAPDWPEY